MRSLSSLSIGSILGLFLLFCTSENLWSQTSRPNIIYIYADDLGYGELGSYGQTKIRTPHLDQLAAEGIRFTRHYSSAPVCAPSRCMLLTGRHPGHAFIRGNYELGGFEDDKEGGQMPLPEGTITIAKLLKEAGYATGAIGKWGLGMEGSGHPNNQGFDYFYGYLDQKQAHNYYPTHLWENKQWDTLANTYIDVHKRLAPGATDAEFDYFKGKDYAIDHMTDRAMRFIEQNKTKPFFLYLPYTIPHASLQIPDAELAAYRGQFKEEPYYGDKGYSSTRNPLSVYAAMISYLDKQVGAVVSRIRQLGLDEQTIILFSSDNGPTFNGGTDRDFFNSSGGFRGGKTELYEGGIRVPFIARWPGKIPRGRTSGLMSAQYDMFATFLEIAGLPSQPNDGISLLNEMTGEGKTEPREYLYFESPDRAGQLAIQLGNYKGVKKSLKTNPDAQWELYNLSGDPGETKDIAARNPEMIRRLDAIVKKEHWPATIREWEFVNPKFPQPAR